MMASKALVFDIKRFAIHDGRGLRTTVFFKGCPLRCKWCQNPEGLHAKKQVIYLANQCIHCRICKKVALPGQLRYENNRPYIMKNYQGNYDHIIDEYHDIESYLKACDLTDDDISKIYNEEFASTIILETSAENSLIWILYTLSI